MNLPTWFYIAGWATILASAAALETLAILDKGRGDTLTEQVRFILGLSPAIWFAGAGLAVWAVLHFFWGRV